MVGSSSMRCIGGATPAASAPCSTPFVSSSLRKLLSARGRTLTFACPGDQDFFLWSEWIIP